MDRPFRSVFIKCRWLHGNGYRKKVSYRFQLCQAANVILDFRVFRSIKTGVCAYAIVTLRAAAYRTAG